MLSNPILFRSLKSRIQNSLAQLAASPHHSDPVSCSKQGQAAFKLTRLNSRGMTLLEIMIVVAILGSLVAILGTRVVGQQKKAKVKQAKIQISEISKSLDMYYTDCGHYPTSDQGLNALAPGGESTCTNWGPEPYIKKIQMDPWGSPFVYIFENGNYTLISYGEDKKEGGTGFNADISNND